MNRGRTRKEQRNDQKRYYQELEMRMASDSAAMMFKTKPYEIHDVPSYIKRKYGDRKE